MSRETLLHHLPHEIITDVLSRLPSEYAIPCRQVCKNWRDILRQRDKKQNFLLLLKHSVDGIQLYHGEYDEKSSKKLGEQLSYGGLTVLGYPCISKESIRDNCMAQSSSYRPMVGSHRGLVCFHDTHDYVNDPTYICNPFTQETVHLPQFDVPYKDARKDLRVSGFGYLYATNEYKIVRIYHYYDSKSCEGQIQVYTLGDKRGWRNKGTTDHYLTNCKTNGIFSDGALHWLADTGTKIVAFDLADEKFRSISVPPCFPIREDNNYPRLLSLGGYLSIVLWGRGKTNVWSLKKTKNQSDYTVKVNWSHEFTIHTEELSPVYYYPFALIEENKVLLWRIGRRDTLSHYDPKTATVEELADGDAERFEKYQVIPYMKSDVSLTELEPDLPVVKWDQLSTPLEDSSSYYSD